MCPDKSLLSAYYDGEVPSPWKDQIKEHVEQCASCSKILDGFAFVSSNLENDKLDYEASEETFNAILLKARNKKHANFVHRRVSIPFPVAAAAIFAVMAAFLGINFIRPQTNFYIVSDGKLDLSQSNISVTDLNELEKIIEGNTQMNNMVVQLPETEDFTILGDSQFIRSVDYQGYQSR